MKRYIYLKNCNVGDWIYFGPGELYQVIKGDFNRFNDFALSNGYIRCWTNNSTTKVYPLTLRTKVIAENIHYYYKEMHRKDLIHGSEWVDWLENKFHELMLLEDDAPKEAFGEIYTSIEEQIEKLETLKNLEEDGKR